ncbi:TPA_asm: nucleoprotein [Psilorhabdovirus 1]|nr:TPA_asm: nucleoprotein [Psilorhabdovirus 1]
MNKSLSNFDFSSYVALDPKTRLIKPLSNLSVSSIKGAEYYPGDAPKTQILFEYHTGAGWSLDLAAGRILSMLRSGSLPEIEVQIYFLVEYFKTKVYMSRESFKVGAFEVKADTQIPSDLFLDFKPKPGSAIILGDNTATADVYEGLALWILVQARIGKYTGDRVRRQYVESILRTLKDLCVSPPFNLSSLDVSGFPSDPLPFAATASHPQIFFMASVYDYYAVAAAGSTHTPLRFSTLTTRFHDQIAISLMDSVLHLGILEVKQMTRLWITPGLAADGAKILKPENGLDNIYSLTPYSRSMGLVAKSMYSLTENPHMCTFCAVLLAASGSPNQTLIAKPPARVEFEITIAIKAYRLVGASVEIGPYADDKEDSRGRLKIFKDKLNQGVDSVDAYNIADRIIEEVKLQGGIPTEDELSFLIGRISQVSVRPGSLCEFIKSMKPYLPPSTSMELVRTRRAADWLDTVDADRPRGPPQKRPREENPSDDELTEVSKGRFQPNT